MLRTRRCLSASLCTSNGIKAKGAASLGDLLDTIVQSLHMHGSGDILNSLTISSSSLAWKPEASSFPVYFVPSYQFHRFGNKGNSSYFRTEQMNLLQSSGRASFASSTDSNGQHGNHMSKRYRSDLRFKRNHVSRIDNIFSIYSRSYSNQRHKPKKKISSSMLAQKQVRNQIKLKPITITDDTSVTDFANLIDQSISKVENALRKLGEHVESEEDMISLETAELLGLEFDREIIIKKPRSSKVPHIIARQPIAVVMGHVDHGKTTLLDALRRTNVVKGEAGGITQHLGAFEVSLPDSKTLVTFLDTPGHFAFQNMRACGARVTDLVILIVAADDGVKPQTREAISLIKAAKCRVIVGITKCDLPGADIEKVCRQLAGEGIQVEGYGGDVQMVQLAVPKGKGLNELEQALLLESELMDLAADESKQTKAMVIESRIDRGQGPVALAIMSQGILRNGDIVVVGSEWGKVRTLKIPYGKRIGKEGIGPGRPIEITGLKGLPSSGDILSVVSSEERAQRISRAREARVKGMHVYVPGPRVLRRPRRRRRGRVWREPPQITQTEEVDEEKTLPIIIKGDVQGSVKALKDALEMSGSPLQVVHTGVGSITESDISLAVPFDAILLGFNVKLNSKAESEAKVNDIDVFCSPIIYEIIEHVETVIAEAKETEMQDVFGSAEVLTTFKTSSKEIKLIAGCRVIDGTIKLGENVRIMRGDEIIAEGKCASLRQHKLDVHSVEQGKECGIGIKGFDEFQPGDILQCVAHE